MNREAAIRAAGLRTYDVYSVYSMNNAGQPIEGSTVLMTCLASSQTHALDRYIRTVDETYSGITSMIENSDDDCEGVYTYYGQLVAVVESAEVFAIERPVEFPTTINESLMNATLEQASQSFWADVNRNFPCETGDLDPLTVDEFNRSMRVAVTAWVAANAPRRYAAVVFDISEMTETQADHLIMEASVQGESGDDHPEAASQSVQACFVGTLDDLIDDLPESWQR